MTERLKIQFLLFLKVAVATIILYIGLTFKISDVGEQFTHTSFRNYLELNTQETVIDKVYQSDIVDIQSVEEPIIVEETINYDPEMLIQNAIQDMQKPSHPASSKMDYKFAFQKVCFFQLPLCMKVKFEGSYTDEEKYRYLAGITHVATFLDDNIQVGKGVISSLKGIVVNNDDGSRRGYAQWYNINFNLWSVNSDDEFLELVTHEMGHIVDLGVVQWQSRKVDRDYTEFGKTVFAIDDPSLSYYALSWMDENTRKASTSREDFCSGYGQTDPFEDFAECFNLYINHQSFFKYIAQSNDVLGQKYNLIAYLLDGEYVLSNTSDLVHVKNNLSWRPWDTTRM